VNLFFYQLSIITFIEVTRGSNPYSQDSLEIHALHPGLLYAQDHLANTGGKDNEISVILRVNYGDFTGLFLADIEGAGLKECVDLSIANPNEFIANLVKIPHHGAWPKNFDDLQKLLETINAEIAVLSVGSTNRYGHVVPELFNLLINLQNDDSKQLKQFVCTEFTRTCVHSASDTPVGSNHQSRPHLTPTASLDNGGSARQSSCHCCFRPLPATFWEFASDFWPAKSAGSSH
jgi:hypothetical protein